MTEMFKKKLSRLLKRIFLEITIFLDPYRS